MIWKILLLLFTSSLFASECEHYYFDSSGSTIKHKVIIGRDIGVIKNSSGKGFYDCKISKIIGSDYLYIGEVGDASKVEIIGRRQVYSFEHGYDSSSYTRYLPLFVNLKHLELSDEFNFKIFYRDIFPYQVGLRSGKPRISKLSGVFYDVITNSGKMLYHILQIILLVSLLITMSLRKSNNKRLGLRILLCVFASLSLVQLTAVPRTFLSPFWAIKLNDFVQIAFWYLVALNQFELVYFTNKVKRKTIRWFSIVTILSSATLLGLSERDNIYVVTYGLNLFVTTLLPSSFLIFMVYTKRLRDSCSFRSRYLFISFIVSYFIIFTHDFMNLVFFSSSNAYLSHFLIIAPCCFILDYLCGFSADIKTSIRTTLRSLREEVLIKSNEIKKDNFQSFVKTLNEFVQAERISVVLFKGTEGKFLAVDCELKENNEYNGILKIESTKHLSKLALSENYLSYSQEENDNFLILKICLGMDGNIFLSMKNINNISLLFNILDDLDYIYLDVKQTILSLFEKTKIVQQNKILELFVNHVHELQIDSQDFFLNHFNIDDKTPNHFFIYGDMVDSVTLNDIYGADTIRLVLEDQIRWIWEKGKEIGFVINIKDGDAFSFIVPKVQGQDHIEHENRVLKLFGLIMEVLENSHLLCPKFKINDIVRHKFTGSFFTSSLTNSSNNSMKNLRILASNEIDLAARFLEKIAQPNEIIITEVGFNFFQNYKDNFCEVDTVRCKGKSKTYKGFVFIQGTGVKVA